MSGFDETEILSIPHQEMQREREARRLCVRGCPATWLALLFVSASLAQAQTEPPVIRFGVLGLFHPRVLVLEPFGEQVISIARGESPATPALVLNGEPGHRQVTFRAESGRVNAGEVSAVCWTATARNGGLADFQLSVPSKMRRRFRGRVTLCDHDGELLAVVSMDRETAVASIVSAEMDGNSPVEALKAQAVATRSFLASGARHRDFDFCDTTHCQFLKSPPTLNSRISAAVQTTKGLVMQYEGRPLAALYSSRCGGRTRSLRDVHLDPGDGYPYYAVPCRWCRRHPFVWRSRIGNGARTPRPDDETRRIAEARHWGWSAIPSSDFTATQGDEGWQLEGHSLGHGIGMCQYGAVGMANSGAGFRAILNHYYPNTTLIFEP